MFERREYRDDEIVIRHGVTRMGAGWCPVARVNNGKMRWLSSAPLSLDEAADSSAHYAAEESRRYSGDWKISFVDVGEVRP